MGLFDKKKPRTLEELEEELDRAKLETEVMSYEAATKEKEAVIAQLKKEYGHDWRKQLGLKGSMNIADLKAFLRSARGGLEKAGMGKAKPAFSPLPSGAIKRA